MCPIFPRMIAMRHLRFALLVAIVAVVGHDATYALGHGLAEYPHALGDTGHDGYWLPVVLGVLGLVLAVAALVVWRWRRLTGQLRALGWSRRGAPAVAWRAVLGQATRLCVAALAVFVVQENLEHLATHGGHLPGLGVLVGHGLLTAVPAFAAVALLVAALGQLVATNLHRLESELARARASLPRAERSVGVRPAPTLPVRPTALSTQPDLGRAPPAASAIRA